MERENGRKEDEHCGGMGRKELRSNVRREGENQRWTLGDNGSCESEDD